MIDDDSITMIRSQSTFKIPIDCLHAKLLIRITCRDDHIFLKINTGRIKYVHSSSQRVDYIL